MSKLSSIISGVIQLKDKLLPQTLIMSADGSMTFMEYSEGGWDTVSAMSERQSIFSQRVFLVPDELTFFKLRQFPVDAVRKKTLLEAVELDLARWSPWQEGVDFFYWPKRHGEIWDVAVWVWKKTDVNPLMDSLEQRPTHVVPNVVMSLATLKTDYQSFVYIDLAHTDKWNLAYVGLEGIPLKVSEVDDESGVDRFWKSLGRDGKELPLLISERVELDALPSPSLSSGVVVTHGAPNATVLGLTRQPGTSDWFDPFIWAKPLAVLIGIYILWLLGTGVVFLKQGRELSTYVAEMSSSSIELLDRRTNVERINTILESVEKIRKQQIAFESVLAELSQSLPKNAWLEYVEYNSGDGGWLDIGGKSDQSAGLAAELEKMSMVQQAIFLNDIRKDQRTGLEPFKLRLKLVE